MPALEGHLHYRNVDVSTIKELSRRWYSKAYFNSPAKSGNHRALADIQESIEELRYYREAVFVAGPGRPTADLREIAGRHQGALTGHRAPRAVDAAHKDFTGEAIRARLGSRIPTRVRDMMSPAVRSDGGYSSAGRAPGCGPGCRGFKSRYSP